MANATTREQAFARASLPDPAGRCTQAECARAIARLRGRVDPVPARLVRVVLAELSRDVAVDVPDASRLAPDLARVIAGTVYGMIWRELHDPNPPLWLRRRDLHLLRRAARPRATADQIARLLLRRPRRDEPASDGSE